MQTCAGVAIQAPNTWEIAICISRLCWASRLLVQMGGAGNGLSGILNFWIACAAAAAAHLVPTVYALCMVACIRRPSVVVSCPVVRIATELGFQNFAIRFVLLSWCFICTS